MRTDEELYFKPSTIETIDTGFFEYVRDKINIHAVTNKGFEKVPVLWVSPERAYQVKHNKSLRDSVGRLRLPVITIERTSVVKDPSFKGAIQAHVHPPPPSDARAYKGGGFMAYSRINQVETAKRQSRYVFKRNAQNQHDYPGFDTRGIVYDDYFVPVPTYVAITYTIVLKAEYQQQMNTMTTPFITRTGQINHFVFKKDGHKFESFIQQDFSQDNNTNNLSEEERYFSTKIEIKVLGYLIGDGENNTKPQIIKRQSVVSLVAVEELILEPFDAPDDTQPAPQPPNGVITIGQKCYIRKRVQEISELDRTGFRAVENPTTGDIEGFESLYPTAGATDDEIAAGTLLPNSSEWMVMGDYEPGSGELRTKAKITPKPVEVDCTTGEILDPDDKAVPKIKEF